jgi:hypothetical protein
MLNDFLQSSAHVYLSNTQVKFFLYVLTNTAYSSEYVNWKQIPQKNQFR